MISDLQEYNNWFATLRVARADALALLPFTIDQHVPTDLYPMEYVSPTSDSLITTEEIEEMGIDFDNDKVTIRRIQ